MLRGLLDRTDDKHVAIVIGASAAVAIVLGVVLPILTMSSPCAPTGQAQLTCPSCGHHWQTDLHAHPRCPKCGAEAGVIPIWYLCPSCRQKFKGGEVRMVGPGDYRYRVAGREKWVAFPTQAVVCPNCRKRLPDPDTAMIRNAADRPKP